MQESPLQPDAEGASDPAPTLAQGLPAPLTTGAAPPDPLAPALPALEPIEPALLSIEPVASALLSIEPVAPALPGTEPIAPALPGIDAAAAPPAPKPSPLRAWITGRDGWKGLVRLATIAVASAAGLWQLSLFLRIFVGRVSFPFDIEWLEGSALYQGYRWAYGQSTYAPPDRGYLPLFHPPGYPVLVGIVGRIVGFSFTMGRTISFLFIVLAGVIAVVELLRENKSQRGDGVAMGLLAVGCAVAAIPLSQSFYDLVREDSMAVGLCVLAAMLAMPREMKPGRIALLGFLLTTALYTRLVMVFLIAWIVVFVFARNRRAGVHLALTTAALCGIELVLLEYGSKGWYWIYTVSALEAQAVIRERFWLALRFIYEYAPFLPALPLVAAVLALTKRMSARTCLWFGLLVASFPASLLPYAKVGGYANDFMPIAFLTGPAALFLASDAIRALAKRPRIALTLRSLVFLGGAFFLFERTFDIKPYIPSEDEWKRARGVNKLIDGLSGGVIAPRQPWVPLQHGSTTQQLSDMPYLDAAWSGITNLNIGGYLDKIHAKWALVAGTEVYSIVEEMSKRYRYDGVIPSPPTTIIGEYSSLKYLLRWQEDEKGARILFDFEQPTLEGWTITGDAFTQAPTVLKAAGQGTIVNLAGRGLADSFRGPLFDKATGSMVSPVFTIDRPHLGMRIGGGRRSLTRVELRINGRAVKSATPIYEGEVLFKVLWDVASFQGKEAQIAIIDDDEGSWGHILCDQVILF